MLTGHHSWLNSSQAITRPRAAGRLPWQTVDNRPPRFQRVKAPDKGELEELVQLISRRVGSCLERQGLLEQDDESAWLELDPAEDTDAMPQILGSSVSTPNILYQWPLVATLLPHESLVVYGRFGRTPDG